MSADTEFHSTANFLPIVQLNNAPEETILHAPTGLFWDHDSGMPSSFGAASSIFLPVIIALLVRHRLAERRKKRACLLDDTAIPLLSGKERN